MIGTCESSWFTKVQNLLLNDSISETPQVLSLVLLLVQWSLYSPPPLVSCLVLLRRRLCLCRNFSESCSHIVQQSDLVKMSHWRGIQTRTGLL